MSPLIEADAELLASLRALANYVKNKPVPVQVVPAPTITPVLDPVDIAIIETAPVAAPTELPSVSEIANEDLPELADLLAASVVENIEATSEVSSDIATNKLIPRGYQLEGIKVLRDKKRALLYDLAGLGKTLQATEAAVPPVIVACPTYLVYQWADFLENQYPGHKVVVCDGPRLNREKLLSEPADWYIINIEMLADRKLKNSDTILSYEFPKVTTFIIDESHHVRGRNSSQSRGALELAEKTERVYLLTATPQYKAVDDLFMQLRIIDRKRFSSYNLFLAYYCRVSQNGFGQRILGPRSHRDIQELLKSVGIGRTYADVAVELPELIRTNVSIRADENFMREYNKIKHTFTYNEHDLNSMMEAMQVLRRVTAKVKVGKMLEILLANPEPEGLIITWYKDTARTLSEILKIPCITGETPLKERAQIAKDNNLLVATMASIGEGVDLSHLSDIIFVESDFVPGRIYQTLSRVRRARTNPAPVKCTFLFVKGTIDEQVYIASGQRNADIRRIMKATLLGDDYIGTHSSTN